MTADNLLRRSLDIAAKKVEHAEKKPSLAQVDFAERALRLLRPLVQEREEKTEWSALCERLAKVRDSICDIAEADRKAQHVDVIIAIHGEPASGAKSFLVKPRRGLMQAKEGERVKARIRIYDLPGRDFGPPDAMTLARYPRARTIHAEPGEEGVIVHAEEGTWPTATFDRTGTSTMITDAEAELTTGELHEHQGAGA